MSGLNKQQAREENDPLSAHKLYALQLAEQAVSVATDNLHRAMAASKGCDVNSKWGQSGQNLTDIIAGYRRNLERAEETLRWLRSAQ